MGLTIQLQKRTETRPRLLSSPFPVFPQMFMAIDTTEGETQEMSEDTTFPV